MKLLGSRVADFCVSTNEIDLNMGLDLGLWKICDHITEMFVPSIKGREICFISKITIAPHRFQLARPLVVFTVHIWFT